MPLCNISKRGFGGCCFVCLFFMMYITGVASNLGTKAERDIHLHCWDPQHEISQYLNAK